MLINPFSILKKTINVLVVDDEFEFWTPLKGFLELFGIYFVRVAESTGTALKIINESEKHFHGCLLDRGMNDVERNEFYLLDKFGKAMPFIIMTARDYSQKTFECGRKGAKAYLMKNSVRFRYEIVSTLNKFALPHVICPKYIEGDQSLLCRSVDALIGNNPQEIKEWAVKINIEENKLWREWKKHLGVSPKYALCVFHLYSKIFARINDACINNKTFSCFDPLECGDLLLNSKAYKKCLEYYLLNRQAIGDYVSRKILSPVIP